MGNGFSWPEWSAYPEGPTSWMPPVYPLIMAGIFKVFGIYSMQSALALELLLTIVSVLSCGLLYLLGKRLYNAQVGLIAAFLLAIYPPSIYYAVRSVWDTGIFTCCLLVVVLMFLRLADHPNLKAGMCLGIIMGFTSLVNPIIISAYPFASAWLYLKSDSNRSTVMKTIALMLTGFCVVISPWLLRNYLLFGQFVFIKSNFGHELYIGLKYDYSSGEPSIKNDNVKRFLLTEDEREFIDNANEASRNGLLLRKAITFIAENPLHFTQQVISRFTRFWTFMRPYPGLQAKVSLTIYLTVLILAVAGLVLSRAKRRGVQLVVLFLLSLPLPYYLTVAHIFRYRFPVEPFLLLFAASMIHWVIMSLPSRSRRDEFAPIRASFL
jgi:4-amino-4-deoxy-L-arabinose transferase-like glycosyltransferase